MEEPTNLQDWELVSFDSDDTNSFAIDDIIHSDYFALDSNKLLRHNHPTNSMDSHQPPAAATEKDKGASFLLEDSKMEVGFEGTAKGESFQADDSKIDLGFERTELGIEENEKGGSFLVDDSEMEVGFEGIAKGESFQADNSKMNVDFERTEPGHHNPDVVASEDELSVQGSEKMEVGIVEIDSIHNKSDEASDMKELVSHSSSTETEMSNSESVSVGSGEKKVLIWWKLPLDILKLCASRVRTVWSVPIAAAFIGILMVGRRLYKMKNKSKRIPLKVSFEDKKAAAQLLLRAARFNEVVVRRVPVIRSPLLPAGGVALWPAVGQL